MTLTVENGTGVLNADSYESAANHIVYAALYGITVTSTQAEINLRKAMDYIESYGKSNGGAGFKGSKHFASTVNVLEFPRDSIYLNGQVITYSVSLAKIIKVLNEAALGVGAGADPLAMKGGKVVSSESFGPLGRQYATSKETPMVNPRVDLFLNPLLLKEVAPLHFRVVSDKESAYLCTHPECGASGCTFLGDGYSYYE